MIEANEKDGCKYRLKCVKDMTILTTTVGAWCILSHGKPVSNLTNSFCKQWKWPS